MPDLPKKKVGIVSCSGEELAEGTVTRLAALKVLEHLRPADYCHHLPAAFPGRWGRRPRLCEVLPDHRHRWLRQCAARRVPRRCIPANLPRALWSVTWLQRTVWINRKENAA